jgi:hypothetical protein
LVRVGAALCGLVTYIRAINEQAMSFTAGSSSS